MKQNEGWILLALVVALSACGTMKGRSKYQLADGLYQSDVFKNQRKTVYIDNKDDTISIYLMKRNSLLIDSSQPFKRNLPQVTSHISLASNTFRQGSFDIDFITMPFKYRPGLSGFPRQFNTNLNGAVYLGYRNDIYQLQYSKTPIKNFQRRTQHYGFSVGLFSGLGSATMNTSVTDNQLMYEYEGVAWSKGVAGILGINNFTLGLAIGYDDLLDHNKTIWIYQRKAWLGLAFGLNIN